MTNRRTSAARNPSKPGRGIWLIEGRDGAGPIAWRAEVPVSQYSDRQMEELLRLLVARAELTFNEILESTGRRRASRAALLEVHRQFQPYALICGSGWWFTARVETRDGPA